MSKPNYTQPDKLPNNRFKVEFDAFVKPTFKQRIKLLLGFNIVTRSYVFVDRKNEEVRAGTKFGFTKELSPEQVAHNHAVE